MMIRPSTLVPIVCCLIAYSLSCNDEESCQLEQRRLEEVKKTILESLNMREPPPKHLLPDFETRAEIIRMFASQADEEHDFTKTSYHFAQNPLPASDTDPTYVAHFNISEREATQALACNLSFHANLQNIPHHHHRKMFVVVAERLLDGSLGKVVYEHWMPADHSRRYTVKIDPDHVRRWYTTSPILGLFVSALVDGQNVAVHPQDSPMPHYSMVLSVTTSKSERNRNRRLAGPPTCGNEHPVDGCCLYNLFINFTDIGWDWIIAPPAYNAYFCKGNCNGVAHHMSRFGHGKVVKAAQRLGIQSEDFAGKSGCCHPTEYDYLKMVYVNRDGTISVANVQGMIARRCGCS